jgi:hypothetical protein
MVPSSVIYSDNLQINFNLHSLTLVLSTFRTQLLESMKEL